MLIDGISLTEGSKITNLTVNSGAAFPGLADLGELFYKTSATAGLYYYNGASWTIIADAISFTPIAHASNETLHLTSAQNTWLDSVSASAAEVNYLSGVTSAVQTQIDGKLSSAAIGTTVQAYDADLTTWAGITPGAGTAAILAVADTASGSVGFRNVPINSQAGAYTLVIGDVGKTIYMPNAGAQAITIPTNAAVAFPIGTAITFVNNGTTENSFTTTSLTVYKAGTSTAWASGGTLSIRGVATILKVATDTWFISGTTLS